MVAGATLTAQALVNQTKFLCQQGLSLYHALGQCRREKGGSREIVHDPLLRLFSPLSGFRRSTSSSLSSTLNQATFHVFMNQVKIGEIEKLSNWNEFVVFLLFFVIIPNNTCNLFSDHIRFWETVHLPLP